MKAINRVSKPLTLLLLVCASFFCMATLRAAAAPPEPREIRVSAVDGGRQVELAEGQVLTIALEANPSTGYMWELEGLDETLLRQTQVSQFEQTSNLLGAPGRQIIRLAAIRAGQTTLSLAYRRPWEKELPSAQTFLLGVRSVGAFQNIAIPKIISPPQSSITSPALVGDSSTPQLASSYNWCDLGGCTPVKNQGSCGSCWAFGTVGSLETNIKIKDAQTKDLAEQYLLSCNTEGYSCNGGWWVHDYHRSKIPSGEPAAGAVYEADFPYRASKVACNPPHSHYEKIASWSYIAGYSVPSATAIKQAIYDHGPVAAAVCVGTAFQAYRSGVFSTNETSACGTGVVNHAIVLVGWNDADQTWVLRNSWGTSWGESGYMRIKWGTSNVGYSANYVVYNGTTSGLAAPSNLTATAASTTQINLSWQDNSSDESDFHIERSPDGSSGWTEIATVSASTTGYSNTGLTCGTTYYYRVRAHRHSDSQYSDYSSTANATTTACSCLDAYEPDATYTTAKSIAVNGTVQTHNFHATGDADWVKFAMTTGGTYTIATSNLGASNDTYMYLYDTNGTTILDQDDDSGTDWGSQIVWTATQSGTYYVRVRHYSSTGGCTGYDYDLVVQASGAAVPTSPSNLSATAIAPAQIRLTWTDNSSDESDFHVERSPDGNADWTEIAIASAGVTSYTVSACDTTFFRVHAHRHSDNQYSDYSNTASATAQGCVYLHLPVILR